MQGVARGNELTNRLTLSRARTLVTPTTSTPPWCKIIRVTFLPCVPSRANLSGQGHAATNLLVDPGTPGSDRIHSKAVVGRVGHSVYVYMGTSGRSIRVCEISGSEK
jgi:hypothetical protein